MRLSVSTLVHSQILFCLFLLGTCTAIAQPVLLFSDIESGPKIGWSATEPEKGAAVSIWGSGFGDNRGASYVTVNGTILESSTDFAVWGEFWPTKHLQRITFWLNDQMTDGPGEITVTINGVQSNALPFAIRDGAIYFMTESNEDGDGTIDNPFDAHVRNSNWVDNMQPGDIYYFDDAQVYDGEYNGGNSVIWIRDSEPSGTADLPIALLAFPGQKPEFAVYSYDVNHNKALKFDNNHMVYSGFRIDSEWGGASLAGDFHRFIGNDVIGLKNKYGSGTGIVVTGRLNVRTGDGSVILGNAIHGGNSQDRYDHAIYLSGCADNRGAEVGWNHIYDNDFGRGPLIVVNHQQDRCSGDQVLDAHFIFNNIVDCAAQRSRSIYVHDLSYDEGEEEPEPTYVYNNVIYSCGTFDGTNTQHIGWAPAMGQAARGSVHFYNNTLYNSGYTGIAIGDRATNSSIRNNIIHMSPDFPAATGNFYIRTDASSVSLSNNLFFGIGDYSPCTDCAMDRDNMINHDPLFVDAENDDLQLMAGSPAIAAGSTDLEFEVGPPSYAPIERDLNFVLRNSSPSIGAYEYAAATTNLDQVVQPVAMMLYPNPANNQMTLELELVKATQIQLSIHDVSGKVVKLLSSSMYTQGPHLVPIDIHDLRSGLYFLSVKDNGRHLRVMPIVVP